MNASDFNVCAAKLYLKKFSLLHDFPREELFKLKMYSYLTRFLFTHIFLKHLILNCNVFAECMLFNN